MYSPTLNEQQTRVLLEGLACMELYLQGYIKKADDQDDRIDASNDLVYVSSLRKHLEQDASKAFGPGVLVQIYPKKEE